MMLIQIEYIVKQKSNNGAVQVMMGNRSCWIPRKAILMKQESLDEIVEKHVAGGVSPFLLIIDSWFSKSVQRGEWL